MTEPRYRLKQLTILVADDQDPMRKSLQRLAKSMGFGEIIDCNDGESAIDYLNKKPVDFIITDLYMRKIGGVDLLEFVRTRDMESDIPVIIVTGEGNQEEIVRAVDKGANDYLLKPFHTTELEKKILKALDSYFTPSEFLKNLRHAEREFVRGNLESAGNFFKIARNLEPTSARAAHGLALARLRLNDENAAINLLKESILLNESYFKSYSTLADIYLKLGQNQEALKYLLKELQINPKQVNRQLKAAHLLLKLGRPKESIQNYRLALKEDPKRMTALMGIGHAMAAIGKLDKALYYFRRVRRYDSDQTKALEAAVRACIAANDWHKAEMFLRDEKTNHPRQIDSYKILAGLYLNQKRFDAALELGKEIHTKNLEIPFALQLKVTALLAMNEPEKAQKELLQLSQIAPNADCLRELSKIFINQGQLEEAEKYLHKALQFESHDFLTLRLIAELRWSQRAWLQAILILRKLISLGDDKKICQEKINECLVHLRIRRDRQSAATLAS